MRDYVKNLRERVVTSKEQHELESAEGQWPNYPEKIQELAHLHALTAPPWETALHGPRERWDAYRAVKTAAPTPASKRHD
jgi:hypothetical protein